MFLREAAAGGALQGIDATLALDDEGCAGVRSTVWHPLSGVEYTGRLRITLPPLLGGAIALYVGDEVPLDVEAHTLDGVPIAMAHERIRFGPGVHLPPDYWLDDPTPFHAPPEITRVTIGAPGEQDLTFRLQLGRRAPRVLARLIGYSANVVVPVCADHVREGERYFATGWYGEAPASDGAVRWMGGTGAVLVASRDGRAVRVRLRAAPAAARADITVSLQVNDMLDLGAQPMRHAMSDYEWSVPDHVWVTGTNELFFTVSQTERVGTRTLGLALASLDVQ